MAEQFNEFAKSKEFRDYLVCLKTSKDDTSKKANKLEADITRLVDGVNNMKVKGKDFNETLMATAGLLELAKQVLQSETDGQLMKYGVENCKNELITVSSLRNNIQIKKIDEMMKQLKSLIQHANKKEKTPSAKKTKPTLTLGKKTGK